MKRVLGRAGLKTAAVAAAIAIAFAAGAPAALGADTSSTFRNGTGIATAQVIRVAPGVGNLGLATTVGTSLSKVANRVAEAQAQAVDLGLVGSSLTARACDGSAGALRPDQLPQPVVADNRKGDSSVSADELPIAGSPLGGGRKEARASVAPSSEADVTGVVANLDPLVQVSNGKSDAITRIVDKNAREAVGTSSIDLSLGGGAVVLKNMQWRADHRTGANQSIAGDFSIGDGTIGTLPAPIDQMKALEDGINTALNGTGIDVSMPHIEHITKPNDVIVVTPMVIEIKDTPVGKAALGPVLSGTREQREQFFNTLAAAYCQSEGVLLVGEIGLDVVSGTGFLRIELGGVSATTGDPGDFNPFGSNEPIGPIADVLPAVLGAVNSSVPPLTATGIEAPPVSAGAAALGPLKTVCESTSKSTRVGCSRGAALPVGIAGVFLTLGVAGLDWLRRRQASASASAA